MGSAVARDRAARAARAAHGVFHGERCRWLAAGLVLGALGLSACSAPADPPRGTAAVGTAAVVEGSTTGAGGAVATAPPAPVQASINVPSLGVNHLVYFLGKERGLYAAEGVEME